VIRRLDREPRRGIALPYVLIIGLTALFIGVMLAIVAQSLWHPPTFSMRAEPATVRPGDSVTLRGLIGGKPADASFRCTWEFGNAPAERGRCTDHRFRVPFRLLDAASGEDVVRVIASFTDSRGRSGNARLEIPVDRNVSYEVQFPETMAVRMGERVPVALRINGHEADEQVDCTWSVPRDSGRVIEPSRGACRGEFEAPARLSGGAQESEVSFSVAARVLGGREATKVDARVRILRPPERHVMIAIDLSQGMRREVNRRVTLLDGIRERVTAAIADYDGVDNHLGLVAYGGRVGNHRRGCEAAQMPVKLEPLDLALSSLRVVLPALTPEGGAGPLGDAVDLMAREVTARTRDSPDALRLLLVIADSLLDCRGGDAAATLGSLGRTLTAHGLAAGKNAAAIVVLAALDAERLAGIRALAGHAAYAASPIILLGARSTDELGRGIAASLSLAAAEPARRREACRGLRSLAGEQQRWLGDNHVTARSEALCPNLGLSQ